MNVFFVAINLIGLVLNLNLYYIDIKYNDSVLDKVDSASSGASDQASTEGNENNKRRLGSPSTSDALVETNSRGSRNSH